MPKVKEKRKEYMNEYRLENYEKIREQRKQYYLRNKEKIKEKSREYFRNSEEKRKEYYERNKERIKENRKKRYLKNRKKELSQNKIWKDNNKKKRYLVDLKWRKRNLERINILRKNNAKNRRKTDIKFRLNEIMSRNIWSAIKGKKAGRRWEILLRYTTEDLIKHLESNFEKWMSWDNYGAYRRGGEKKWHIDHIKPKSLFKYKTPEDPEFKECWGLKNLQPLEAVENIKKYNYFNHIIMKEIIGTRVCPVCGKEYPIDEQGFYVDGETTYVSCCDESDLKE